MARRLALLKKGDWDRFEQLLGAQLSAEEVELLNAYPQILKDTLAGMRRHPDYIAVMGPPVEPIDPNKNPFEQSVDEQIAALRLANVEEGWGITEETFDRLIATAPTWPKGRNAFRSFRIRFGEGADGVALTFERHAARMERVYGAKYGRSKALQSVSSEYRGRQIGRLRLLNGDSSHHAVVEWFFIADFEADPKSSSISAVRGADSLADEGLVMAWLFLKRLGSIDRIAWYCAGYEVNVPECDNDSKEWNSVVLVVLHDGWSGLTVGLVFGFCDALDRGYLVPDGKSARRPAT